MSRPRGLFALAAFALFVAVAMASSLYRVEEDERVVITRFGRPTGRPVGGPGLHFKTPIVDEMHHYSVEPKSWRWSGELTTRDRELVVVELTATWKMNDPLLVYQTLRNEAGAEARLDEILRGQARQEVARMDAVDLLLQAPRRAGAPEEGLAAESSGASLPATLASARDEFAAFGIELIGLDLASVQLGQR